jgi:hypothetical protein
MEMVESHTEKIAGKHNLSGIVMESPRKERKRKTQKHLETEIKRTGISWKDLEIMTLGKKAWRDMVVEPCLHGATR